MAATIKIKNSSTAGAAPTSSDLVQGELAVNVTDKRLYTENASGTIVELGTNPSVPVTFPDGSASAPSLTNDGDTNTGLFFPAADTVGIATGGTERARVDSSGNLGLGTSSPSSSLHITSTTPIITLTDSDTGANSTISASSGEGSLFISADANNVSGNTSMRFLTDGTERMRIDSSGNLGLGVTPSAWNGFTGFQVGALGGLNIGGSIDDSFVGSNVYYNAGFKFARATTATYATMYRQTGGVHNWQVSTATGTAGNAISFTQAMTLDASGNLGVGITSPNYKLDVQVNPASGGFNGIDFTDGTNTVIGLFKTGSAYTYGTGVGSNQSWIYSNVGDLNITSDGSGIIKFQRESGTESARIDSSGNLLVGTTSATAGWGAGGKLTVDSGSSFAILKNSQGASAPPLLCWNAVNTGDDLFIIFATETAGSTKGTIDFNRAGGLTRYNTTSDATLKNIIGDADSEKSVEILSSTRIREYSWKDDETNKPQIGVIAQELHETFTGAVSVGGDRVFVDEEGNETTQYVPWAVDKTAFTFHLVAGWQAHERIIQEQQAIITQLQADVAALKGQA